MTASDARRRRQRHRFRRGRSYHSERGHDARLPATVSAAPARSGGRFVSTRQASRTGSKSRSSEANSRAAAARCSSHSANLAALRQRCQQGQYARARRTARVRPISPDRPHFVRHPPARLLARCSSMAAWHELKRRLCAISQMLKCGLRSISSPSRKSPAKSLDRARNRSRSSVSMPSSGGRGDIEWHRRNSRPDRARPCRRRFRFCWRPGSSRTPRELAEAPAQFAARIVGHIPQQIAETAASDRHAASAR